MFCTGGAGVEGESVVFRGSGREDESGRVGAVDPDSSELRDPPPCEPDAEVLFPPL